MILVNVGIVENSVSKAKTVSPKGNNMNEKQAKKVRKETRLYWQRYIARFASLPLWERVKLAFAIVTLRANNRVHLTAAGVGTGRQKSNSGGG